MPYHLSQTSGCFSLLGHPVFLPRPDASFPSDWVSTLTHSHHLRGKERPVGEVNRLLVDWCRAHRIRAFGLGSPWEPVTAAAVEKYETTEREAYDAGRVDLPALRFEPEVRAHLADLNRLSNGDTLFYLDNETPVSSWDMSSVYNGAARAAIGRSPMLNRSKAVFFIISSCVLGYISFEWVAEDILADWEGEGIERNDEVLMREGEMRTEF